MGPALLTFTGSHRCRQGQAFTKAVIKEDRIVACSSRVRWEWISTRSMLFMSLSSPAVSAHCSINQMLAMRLPSTRVTLAPTSIRLMSLFSFPHIFNQMCVWCVVALLRDSYFLPQFDNIRALLEDLTNAFADLLPSRPKRVLPYSQELN